MYFPYLRCRCLLGREVTHPRPCLSNLAPSYCREFGLNQMDVNFSWSSVDPSSNNIAAKRAWIYYISPNQTSPYSLEHNEPHPKVVVDKFWFKLWEVFSFSYIPCRQVFKKNVKCYEQPFLEYPVKLSLSNLHVSILYNSNYPQ